MTNPSLLVVDRDAAFASDVKRIAEDVGFTVELASTGPEFQGRYLEGRPDVLAMEVFLADLDGLELITWLAEQESSAPLLAFTDRGPQYLRAAEALAALKGRFAVKGFAKPIDLPALRLALEAARASLVAARETPGGRAAAQRRAAQQQQSRDPRSIVLESARLLGDLHKELEQTLDDKLAVAALGIEKEILQRPATSVEEAAVQLMLIVSLVDRLAAQMRPDQSVHMALISSSLRSILTLISSITVIDLGKFGSRWYLPADS
jgi:CheY-like chemotaxis protein